MNNRSKGYIKLYRSLLDWEWYSDINTTRLFLHILFKANHIDKKWHGNMIQKGSFITGMSKLSQETKLSVQQIRTSLNKLKSTNEITSKSTNEFTLITVEKYADYQCADNEDNKPINKPINKRITNEQQTDNKRITTTKELKNLRTKELKKLRSKDISNSRFTPPTLEEVKSYCLDRNNSIDAEKFIDFYSSKGWMIGKNKMKDWKASVRTWEKGDKNGSKDTEAKTHYGIEI